MTDVRGFVRIDRGMLDNYLAAQLRDDRLGLAKRAQQKVSPIQIKIQVAGSGNFCSYDSLGAAQLIGEPCSDVSGVLFLTTRGFQSFGEFERNREGKIAKLGARRHLDWYFREI